MTFSNNRGVGDAGGVASLYFGSLTFNGKTTFDSNWTGNYGGAISVYQAQNYLTFNGDTTFKNNHAVVFGGALDVWGGASTITFNGPGTTFDGNYIHYIDGTDIDHPIHVTDQHPRGGAINVGYLDPGAPGASLIFNTPTTFTNNYVVSTGANKNALGGAISVYGNLTPQLYRLTFNDAARFQGNYVYATGANLGNGGAIYYDSSAAVINLSSGTQFLNNYAKTSGGAIYLRSGTINLNAATSDIIFQGNRQGVSFDASFKPIATTGTPNAIYLGASGNLNLITSAGRTINLYDPIASVAGSTVTVTKSGAGEFILHGDGGLTSSYDSNIQANTLVQGGYFTLADGVKYGSTAAGTTFRTQNGGTVRGSNGGALRASSFLVETGGALGVVGGTFTVDSPSITLQNGTMLTGYGTLASSSNINLGGTVTADIAATRTLNATSLMVGTGGIVKTGAGVLTLSASETYTGATTVSGGTLSAGTANIFANSSAVTVGSGATFALNNYAQIAQNISGGGAISLGSAALAANNSSNTIFSGGISGTGRLTKGGAGSLTLSGASVYSGGTTISSGRLIATGATSLGSGAVSNAGTLELAFAGSASMANQLTGAGAVEKTGAGTLTLTNGASSVGALSVKGGTLSLAENGTFSAASYSTETGAATSIGTNAKLAIGGAFTQAAGSTLNVGIGATNNPAIMAGSATIGGALTVGGYITVFPPKASELNSNQFAILRSSTAISGNFSSVNLSGFTSPVDYLTLGGGKSADQLSYSVGLGLTWLAGAQNGNGIFTLANAADTFDVDVVLANQVGSATGWNGTSLTKNGAGNLTLSAANTYSGATTINNGTLTTGAANVFANSGAVTVNSGATLALGGGYAQTAQNLSGGGAINLGSAALTANNSGNTTFSGAISGTGRLVKGGTGSLTLSGTHNNYSGGTTVSGGRLIATNGAALGSGAVSANAGTLELAFAANGTLTNRLNGSGLIEKTGSAAVTLNNTNSSVGTMDVKGGNLIFAQNGTFTAGTYTTETGATTTIGSASKLVVGGAFTQTAGSNLTVTAGTGNNPSITAVNATIGGALTVSGVDTTHPPKASDLAAGQFTVLKSTNVISGNFSSVNLSGFTSPVDYLTVAGGKSADQLSYSVGLGLTWLAGAQNGNGIFTLANAADTFDVDVVLANQVGSATGWNGTSLTKNGAGNLTLSAANTYSGATTINNGTLTTGAANVFANSGAVTVNSGATLALNNHAQIAQNLSGGGAISLGSAVLTANNSGNTTFSGAISGTGRLVKGGAGSLTLSGTNNYSGGTTVSGGRLIATNGAALGSGAVSANAGTLELAFAANGTLTNRLNGSGIIEKTGSTAVTLNNTTSSVGTMDVKGGNLIFAQNGTFTAGTYTIETGATTTIGSASKLVVGGAFTQTAGSALTVTAGTGNNPSITAVNATIGGALTVNNVNTTHPLKASDLGAGQFTVLKSTNIISGDFSSVNLGGTSASVDYLTLGGGKSADQLSYSVGLGLTWLAGAQTGNGIFTLANAADTFDVDVVLANQVGSATGWNGTSLTKNGAGNLTLSAANTYSGATTINNGTLTTGAANVFANSGAVTVNSGATLALNNHAQIAQNLSGNGAISLGSAALTANNSGNTTFSGAISGTGRLIKGGAGSLTLSGASAYSGGTTVSGGRLIATGASSLGSGVISANAGTLELTFAANGTLTNRLNGSGLVEKTGSAAVTLNNTNSSVGTMDVKGGNLIFAQNGAFNAGTYTTETGATTTIGSTSKLVVGGAFTQTAGSNLTVTAGTGNNPSITAVNATIGGALTVSGVNTTHPLKASDLIAGQFTVLKSTNVISGDFSSVNLGGTSASVDYLTIAGGKSVDQLSYSVGMGLTWLAGAQNGNGIFTLANAADTFDVDVVLSNQAGSATGWNGTSLTKNGAGNLTLSAANTYSGATTINNGTLTTGAANVFAQSGAVTVNSGATLALGGGYAQTAQNLSGNGAINLGSAALTANNSGNTTFSGAISGTGRLVKGGTGSLTLSGTHNNYSGGTIVSGGRLIATNGAALGSGAVSANAGTLELAFAANGTLTNRLNGSGLIEKTGSAAVTLNNVNSSVGTMDVKGGNLIFAQNGAFNAGTYTTETGATTTIGSDSELKVGGAFAQAAGSNLTVGIGATNDPAITAGSATIGGALTVSGVDTTHPLKASDLIAKQFTVLKSTNIISGDFNSVSFGGASASVDYLTIAGGKSVDQLSYSVGMGLTWLAGAQNGNGIFTLANAADTFDVDVVLTNQAGSATGWNGTSLTKNGAGNLTLSAANTYSGATTINNGTLTTGAANVFANSGAVTVNSGATLALGGGYAQTAQNLSGNGAINLGSAALTANNSGNTTFSGAISGTGRLIKGGTGSLTLSGTNNNYSGGTTISGGRLIATNGAALGSGAVSANAGTLELAFAGDGTLSNELTGGGTVEKTGAGIVTLSNDSSSVGAVDVTAGTLFLDQDGVFTAGTYDIRTGAATTIGTSSSLNVSGAFTEAAGGVLNAMIGNNLPMVTADTASLAGDLAIAGFDPALPASVLTATRHIVLRTNGGISGDFNSVHFGGITTGVDYLLLDGAKNPGDNDYSVGFALTWTSGTTTGDGKFSLLDEANIFNVDVLLADRAASATGWNGRDLTKIGDGTLILSHQNSYTGETAVNGGVLSLQENLALGKTSQLAIDNGATVALNGASQIVGKLTTEVGSRLEFGGGILTISDAQRISGDASGGSIQANTLFGAGGLIVDPSIVEVFGANSLYTGDVTVTGGSQIIMNNASGVGDSGLINLVGANDLLTFGTLASVSATGTLKKALAGVGAVQTRSGADITLDANNGAFSGLFDVGSGTTLRAASAADLGTADIELAGALDITTASNWTMINPVTGSGSFYKNGAGQLLLNGALADFSGLTYVTDGVLIVGDAVMSNAKIGGSAVDISALGTLSGAGAITGNVVNNGVIAALNSISGYEGAPATGLKIGPLSNAGTIRLAGSNVGNTLTVKGGMTSLNGSVVLNTVLGGDDSLTDRLILDGGATSGATSLVVQNQGGRGRQTQDGILLVDAINGATTASNAFVLSASSSGYRSTTGTLAVGGFDYSLVRGGAAGSGESWYLSSLMESARPEAGVYLVNREAAENMFMHSMHDRLEGFETRTNPLTGERTSGPGWARMYVTRRTSYADDEKLKTDTDAYALQTGLDLFGQSDDSFGAFHAGMMLGKGLAKNDTSALWNNAYKATGDVDGYAVGIYGTWFEDANRHSGFYADTWLQHA